MNQIEKAKEYAEREHVHKFMRDAAERAFIAGSKSGYSAGVSSGIEIARNNDELEKYNADKYVPEQADGVYSQYVVCACTDIPVFYDYEEQIWRDERARPFIVTNWRYPKAIKLEENELEETEIKKSEYDKGYYEASKAIANIDKNRMKAQYNKGYAAGYQEAAKLVNEVQDLRADAKYKLLSETFEEFLSDRIVIKELKDFWRERAGLK